MQSMKLILLALSVTGACALAQEKPALLPALNIDPAQTTVSGISSGGYMAVQLHVAYSSKFGKGVASIAGGPYNCAEGSVLSALGRCLGRFSIPVDALVAEARKAADDKAIDALANLSASKIYVFSMAKDSIVGESTSAALVRFYEAFVSAANIVHKKDVPADHGFVTDAGAAACENKAAPFLNNCGFDLAGAVLGHLYGGLKPRAPKATGKLFSFDQSGVAMAKGLGKTGYAYVPESCGNGTTCRVHVVLHGCKMNATDIGDAFAKGAGFNRWADTNNLVILYPQTGEGATNGCWDWWGYASDDYARKSAPQMKAIVAMVDRLSSGMKK
ncbi:MAG: hypothetical protein JNJ55_06300 [Betaproteobacteria bacterium]|nr:hypothetical protein [Betaproteobacteria bacterium]